MLAAIVFHGLDSGIRQLLYSGIENILSGYNQLLINMGQQVLVEDRLGEVVGVTNSGELKVKINQGLPTPKSQSQILPSEIYLKPGTISLGYDKL